MQEQSVNFKQKITVIKDNITTILSDALAEENLANFKSSYVDGHYNLLPEDNSLLKTCKLLLNICTCLEELAGSLTNADICLYNR